MTHFGLWQWVGLALTAWVLWDLFSGKVWLHRGVYRTQEPGLYWFGILLWACVAALCFFSDGYVY